MAGTRDRALEAAVELLGSEGVRALTHARVDERAGLPRGSTSNHFRTRAALLDGVSGWVAEHEMGDFDPAFDAATATFDDVVDAICALIEAQANTSRARTVARYALFLESVRDAELRRPLVENRHLFEQWTVSMMTALGAPDPDTAARTLMACSDGLILHRVTVDAGAKLRPTVAMVMRACLPLGVHAVERQGMHG